MPPKKNPLKLNPLQLKTLALLQELAKSPDTSSRNDESGEVLITNVPHPHGDHFHIGERVVASRDASGLHNTSVWLALIRKGVARPAENGVFLTREGLAYETGVADEILHGAGHQAEG